MNDIDIEDLMAYADGELEADRTAYIEQLLSSDEEARAMLERFRQTSTLLDPVSRGLLEEPVPQRLIDTVRNHPASATAPVAAPEPLPAATVPLIASRVEMSAANGSHYWPRWAAAASVALAVGLVTGHWWGGQDTGAGTDLAQLLQTVPSGTSVSLAGGSLMPLASFQRADGQPCREFEQVIAGRLSHGIACRSEGVWVTQVLIDRGADQGQIGQPPVFAPASGQADALSAMADALNLGEALEPQQEAQLIRNGWSAPP
jgi:negative regulator of sigma E activity